ncbi:MAG: hypothetical protein IPM91_19370 [Bacteroidetes bacterium]|nr:hypothetical protein [Bacteroidota bacterium]
MSVRGGNGKSRSMEVADLSEIEVLLSAITPSRLIIRLHFFINMDYASINQIGIEVKNA